MNDESSLPIQGTKCGRPSLYFAGIAEAMSARSKNFRGGACRMLKRWTAVVLAATLALPFMGAAQQPQKQKPPAKPEVKAQPAKPAQAVQPQPAKKVTRKPSKRAAKKMTHKVTKKAAKKPSGAK
jgi:hypothetical protein